jgi:hypothetical protein
LDETDEIASEFLSDIENICLNLRKLEIAPTVIIPVDINKEKLCTIIKKQNNLKAVILSSYCQSFLNNIFLSLEFQKHSLVFIEFKKICFDNISLKNFIDLHNLKHLEFYACHGTIPSDQCEILKYASFKLEVLCLKYNSLSSIYNNNYIVPSMIKYLGASLKELILNEPLKIPMIENVLIYCPNLITLEIRISQGIDLSVFSYFKILKIRNLNIDDHWSDTEIFKNLAKNLPTNIKKVSCHFYLYAYKILKLRKFLENCHNCLEIINLNYSIELELLEVILNYIERSNNSLKFLGLAKSKKVLNDEESKLFDQIKEKGVKIGDYLDFTNNILYFL